MNQIGPYWRYILSKSGPFYKVPIGDSTIILYNITDRVRKIRFGWSWFHLILCHCHFMYEKWYIEIPHRSRTDGTMQRNDISAVWAVRWPWISLGQDPPRGSDRVRTFPHGSDMVGASFHIFAVGILLSNACCHCWHCWRCNSMSPSLYCTVGAVRCDVVQLVWYFYEMLIAEWTKHGLK